MRKVIINLLMAIAAVVIVIIGSEVILRAFLQYSSSAETILLPGEYPYSSGILTIQDK